MSCLASPDGSGFHRYQLAPQGQTHDYVSVCVHCGAEKQIRPTERFRTRWSPTAKASAAKRRQETTRDAPASEG
jgi:hypothetical protein